mmetsp:Transcript_35247/g.56151  ORF Transcript_35247/g.56151 Transcript_35247/m.56151 type:complete len:310 (+) Transcript_35247:43-972(+)
MAGAADIQAEIVRTQAEKEIETIIHSVLNYCSRFRSEDQPIQSYSCSSPVDESRDIGRDTRDNQRCRILTEVELKEHWSWSDDEDSEVERLRDSMATHHKRMCVKDVVEQDVASTREKISQASNSCSTPSDRPRSRRQYSRRRIYCTDTGTGSSQSPLTFQMDKDEDIVSERPSSLARNYESLGVEVHSMDAQDYVCLESHSRPPSQPKIDHKINSRTATVSAKHLLDSVGHTSVVGLRRETSNIASPPLVDSICSKSSMSLTSLPSLPRGVPYSSKLQTRLACSKRMQPGHGAVNVRIDDTACQWVAF